MSAPMTSAIGESVERLLARLGGSEAAIDGAGEDAAILIGADLAVRRPDGRLVITDAGRAHLARFLFARCGSPIDPFLGQHLALAQAEVETAEGPIDITVDASESPLAWLARRKGRDGRALRADRAASRRAAARRRDARPDDAPHHGQLDVIGGAGSSYRRRCGDLHRSRHRGAPA